MRGCLLSQLLICLLLLAAGCAEAPGESSDRPPPDSPRSSGLRTTALLNTQEQLEDIRNRVADGDEPWSSGYGMIPSYLDHVPQPVRHYVDAGPHSERVLRHTFRKDSEAAYGSALHWIVSRDSAHVEKAIEILNAWAGELESVDPIEGGHLSTSFNWPRMIYAGEIIRSNYDGWPAEDQAQFESVLKEVVWDATRRAIEKDNKNNWRSVGINCRLAIAVYTRDEGKFDETVELLLDQIGSYCYPSGQSIETTRDLGHVGMGLSGIAAAAEIAWNQGVDAYGHLDNRLLTCVEWHIPHIMGLPEAQWPDSFDSPFYAPEEMLVGDPKVEMWGREVDVREGGFDAPRKVGATWPFYELIYNHYHNRMGLEAPNTWRILTERSPVIDYDNPPSRMIPVRPEGPSPPAGWGTLTHVRPEAIQK